MQAATPEDFVARFPVLHRCILSFLARECAHMFGSQAPTEMASVGGNKLFFEGKTHRGFTDFSGLFDIVSTSKALSHQSTTSHQSSLVPILSLLSHLSNPISSNSCHQGDLHEATNQSATHPSLLHFMWLHHLFYHHPPSRSSFHHIFFTATIIIPSPIYSIDVFPKTFTKDCQQLNRTLALTLNLLQHSSLVVRKLSAKVSCIFFSNKRLFLTSLQSLIHFIVSQTRHLANNLLHGLLLLLSQMTPTALLL